MNNLMEISILLKWECHLTGAVEKVCQNDTLYIKMYDKSGVSK